jgi:hypothetical protein
MEREANSNEHIVLEALGGRRVTSNFLCVQCNNNQGGDIDNSLEKAYRLISVMIGAFRGNGNPVAPVRHLSLPNGMRISLIHGGRPDGVPHQPVRVDQEGEGNPRLIAINARDEEHAAWLLYHQCRRFGINAVDLRATQVESISESVGPFRRQENYGGAQQFRSIAKMGFAAIVRSFGPDRVAIYQFDEVANWIHNGRGDGPLRQLSPELRSSIREFAGSEPGQHVLIVLEDPLHQSTEAIFLAFGFICYRVELAPCTIGLPGAVIHVVDPRAQTHDFHTHERQPVFPPLTGDAPEAQKAKQAGQEMLDFMSQAQNIYIQDHLRRAEENGEDVSAIRRQMENDELVVEPVESGQIIELVRERL